MALPSPTRSCMRTCMWLSKSLYLFPWDFRPQYQWRRNVLAQWLCDIFKFFNFWSVVMTTWHFEVPWSLFVTRCFIATDKFWLPETKSYAVDDKGLPFQCRTVTWAPSWNTGISDSCRWPWHRGRGEDRSFSNLVVSSLEVMRVQQQYKWLNNEIWETSYMVLSCVYTLNTKPM